MIIFRDGIGDERRGVPLYTMSTDDNKHPVTHTVVLVPNEEIPPTLTSELLNKLLEDHIISTTDTINITYRQHLYFFRVGTMFRHHPNYNHRTHSVPVEHVPVQNGNVRFIMANQPTTTKS